MSVNMSIDIKACLISVHDYIKLNHIDDIEEHILDIVHEKEDKQATLGLRKDEQFKEHFAGW